MIFSGPPVRYILYHVRARTKTTPKKTVFVYTYILYRRALYYYCKVKRQNGVFHGRTRSGHTQLLCTAHPLYATYNIVYTLERFIVLKSQIIHDITRFGGGVWVYQRLPIQRARTNVSKNKCDTFSQNIILHFKIQPYCLLYIRCQLLSRRQYQSFQNLLCTPT